MLAEHAEPLKTAPDAPHTLLLTTRLAYLRHEVAAALSAKALAADEESRLKAERDEQQLRIMAARAEEALQRARATARPT